MIHRIEASLIHIQSHHTIHSSRPNIWKTRLVQDISIIFVVNSTYPRFILRAVIFTLLYLVVRCLKNKSAMFAKRLHDAMKGLGTDDNALVRVIISRCEVDMVQIKEEFQKAYNQSLAKFIEVNEKIWIYWCWQNGEQ